MSELKPLPGTPRGLQSIAAHADRLDALALKLWEYDEMRIKHVSNAEVYENAQDYLRNLREDIGAVLSALHDLSKEHGYAYKKKT